MCSNNKDDDLTICSHYRETPTQRADTIWKELDKDGDGLVTEEDMTLFYMVCYLSPSELILQSPGRNASSG